MFETLFYGGLAHHNSEKIADFLRFRNSILISSLCFKCLKQYVAHGMRLGNQLRTDIIDSRLL